MNILTATPPRKVHDPRPQPRKQNYRFLAVALMKTLNPHVRTNFRDAVTQWQAQVGGKAYQKNLGTAKMFFALRRLLLSEAFEDLKAELEPSKQEKKVLQACRVLQDIVAARLHEAFRSWEAQTRNAKRKQVGKAVGSVLSATEECTPQWLRLRALRKLVSMRFKLQTQEAVETWRMAAIKSKNKMDHMSSSKKFLSMVLATIARRHLREVFSTWRSFAPPAVFGGREHVPEKIRKYRKFVVNNLAKAIDRWKCNLLRQSFHHLRCYAASDQALDVAHGRLRTGLQQCEQEALISQLEAESGSLRMRRGIYVAGQLIRSHADTLLLRQHFRRWREETRASELNQEKGRGAVTIAHHLAKIASVQQRAVFKTLRPDPPPKLGGGPNGYHVPFQKAMETIPKGCARDPEMKAALENVIQSREMVERTLCLAAGVFSGMEREHKKSSMLLGVDNSVGSAALSRVLRIRQKHGVSEALTRWRDFSKMPKGARKEFSHMMGKYLNMQDRRSDRIVLAQHFMRWAAAVRTGKGETTVKGLRNKSPAHRPQDAALKFLRTILEKKLIQRYAEVFIALKSAKKKRRSVTFPSVDML